MERTKRKIRTALASTCRRRLVVVGAIGQTALPLTDSRPMDTPLAGLTCCVSISAQVSRHWLSTKGVVYLLGEQLSSPATMKETIERCPCPCLQMLLTAGLVLGRGQHHSLSAYNELPTRMCHGLNVGGTVSAPYWQLMLSHGNKSVARGSPLTFKENYMRTSSLEDSFLLRMLMESSKRHISSKSNCTCSSMHFN